MAGNNEGDSLPIELPDGRLRSLPVAGVVHDPIRLEAALNGIGYGYVTMDTLEWLGMVVLRSSKRLMSV